MGLGYYIGLPLSASTTLADTILEDENSGAPT